MSLRPHRSAAGRVGCEWKLCAAGQGASSAARTCSRQEEAGQADHALPRGLHVLNSSHRRLRYLLMPSSRTEARQGTRTTTHMTQTLRSKKTIADVPLQRSWSPPIDFDFRGLRLAGLELEDAIDWITAQAHAGRQAIVVTPNINHLHLVQVSDKARDAIAGADLQLADGWPIVAASRILRQPLPGRIAGIDLVERLVDGDEEFRVAILGGPSDAALRLAKRARRRNQVVLVDELRPGWDEEEPRSGLAGAAVCTAAAPDLTSAFATLAFDEFLQYTPSWQEVASFAGVIAYGVIVYSLSYRYLPLFAPPKGESTHVSGD